MRDLWLGIDAGTTAVKAAVYDRMGVQHGAGEAPSPVERPSGGFSEQDMDAVWMSVAAAVREAVATAGAHRIACVGVCAQGDGLWTLNAEGAPNGRALLWNDTRAADDVTDLIESGRSAPVGRACHTAIWPGASGALFRWLEGSEPAQAAAVANLIYCADWVGYRLTGELASDLSNATIPFLDLASGGYSNAAIAALDCGRLASLLQPPRRADQILGRVTSAAAVASGLGEGTPVSVGTLDLSAMIVGMGMDRPGQTMMVLGTTAVVNILTDRIEPADHPVGATVMHATSDVMIRVLAPTTGAVAFDWFTGLHPQSLGGESPAEIAAKLNDLAGDVPPGANGVMFLPYLNGERAPFVAPRARGAFHGLTPATSQADMGRAVMEGAAFSLRHCFEAEGGLPDERVHLTGGGARNRLWRQIVADVIGAPVVVSEASDHGLWGAACIGAAAAGMGQACRLAERSEDSETVTPDAARRVAYDQHFARYRAVSEASPPIWAALVEGGDSGP
ncbi:MAG: FGGY family carbohydrate kinase [Pseudomonadota bacterium]